MAQVLEKLFPCKACNNNIRLQRKDDDSGWIRYEADGQTLHNCPAAKKKFQGSSKTLEKLESMEKKIDLLISEVQALRQELKVKT